MRNISLFLAPPRYIQRHADSAGRAPIAHQVQHLKVPFSFYHLTFMLLLVCLVLLAYAFLFINR